MQLPSCRPCHSCAALSCLSEHRDDEDALQATQSIVMHDPAAAVSLIQRLARFLARWEQLEAIPG